MSLVFYLSRDGNLGDEDYEYRASESRWVPCAGKGVSVLHPRTSYSWNKKAIS